MKFKSMAIALIASLGLVLGACSGETNTATPDSGETAGGNALKIAIVTSPSGVDDGSFNTDNYNGILSFIKNHEGATENAIQESNNSPEASVNAVSNVVSDYDVIVTPGFQFAGISELAVANPEKKFILVDSAPAEVDGVSEFENVYSMVFAEQESGFYAGIAAAMETKTNKIAFVGGIAFPPVVNYQFGFYAGVNYANKHLGTKAELVEIASYAGKDVRDIDVKGNYIGDFADQAIGKTVGKDLIDKGVDIIFVAAGGAGNGVFTAAKEATDVKVIGCDVDQFKDGENGDSNIVLTSVLKNMKINVERALEDIANGTFKGANVLKKADTDSTGFVSEEGRHQLSEATLEALNNAYEGVKNGEIVPPGNFAEETFEAFKGL